MRVIKFRAWDGTQMDYDYRDVSLWNGLLVAEGDTILLQFTGLKDRNGKEIYEGDVLGLDDPNDHSRAIVVFHAGAFKPQLIRHMHIFDDDWDWIIIGNIYEHPELIKE